MSSSNSGTRWLLIAALVLTCCGAAFAQAQSKVELTNAYSAYLKLDGRWYGITSTRDWDIDLSGAAVFVDDATAVNCRRANGSYPSFGNGWLIGVGSPMSFFGARTTGNVAVVTKPYSNVPAVIELYSLDGDLQCNGETSAPDLAPPVETPVFINSFE